jgi:Bacterial regulatory proteins, lacI family.
MLKNEYKKLIPYGYKSVVAERAGVSRQSVTAFLNGKTCSKKIEDAVLDVLAELKTERENKLRKAGLLL